MKRPPSGRVSDPVKAPMSQALTGAPEAGLRSKQSIGAVRIVASAEEGWHGCEPALTVVPNFLVTGMLAIVLAAAVFLWAAAFIRR
jgi:hypothetical protein